MIIGMDFGTTNTGAAVFNGDSIQLLPLDPANRTPQICRTSIYITRSKDYYLGSQAVNLYFNQNVGRPTRFRKVRVGEIMQIFSGLPVYYRDVYIYEDEFSPGRLFLSIKTALRNPEYYGTVFLNDWYSPSDLAAIFLMGMKRRMEAHLGRPVQELVLGRPVHFSDNPDEDKVAQSRLLEAAFKAGFTRVYLEYEPVAAALAYERTLTRPEKVLVFDFGGGTLDFTVMEIGPSVPRRVLATGGLPIAGDVFDQRLFRRVIPPHLGENDYFFSGGVKYPIPAHIFDHLTTSQDVIGLNTPENLEMLRSIHLGAVHKQKTHALLRMVSSNYALLMFERIERAKRELSDRTETAFSFAADDFAIEDRITRRLFEQAIHAEYETVRLALEDTLARSGLTASEISRVIRTGGSSQIPLFGQMLDDMFGPEKVRSIDTFSSVTSGLAILAHEIEQGRDGARLDLPSYTPSTAHLAEALSEQPEHAPQLQPVDLHSVLQRMEVTRSYAEGQTSLPEEVLLALGPDGARLFPVDDLGRVLQGERPLAPVDDLAGAEQLFLAPSDRHLLVATSRYRLMSPPIEAAFIAAQASRHGLHDLLRLEEGEAPSALTAWAPSTSGQAYLYLVSRYGQARAFDARLLAEQVLHKPFFQLDRRYASAPAALVPAGEDDLLVAGTNQGRIACASRREIGVSVYDLLRARKNETLTAACACPPGETLLAVSHKGLALPFRPAPVPASTPPAARGQLLRQAFSIAGFVPLQAAARGEAFALTSLGRLLRLSAPEPDDTRPHKAARLHPGEKVLGCTY